MRYGVLGGTWVVIGGVLVACSGVSSIVPPPPSDAGLDGRTESDAGTDAEPDAQPQICKPGATSCDGARVQACSDDGSQFIPKQVCSPSQVCTNGECKELGCVPNSSFCSEGGVWQCGPDGTSSQLSEQCSVSQFCLEKAHTATCSVSACFGDDAMCVGNVATHCRPDGSGPKPGGSDCAAANQICYEGACRDQLCTPGLKVCSGTGLYLCSEAGTGITLITDCTDQTACDADTGACLPRICEPGKLGCNATSVVTCNPQGTRWLQSGPDCATSNALCADGACTAIICKPDHYLCKGDSLHRCNTDGTATELLGGCGDNGGHCFSNDVYAYCGTYVCTPGVTGCDGNLLTTCKLDGSGWVDDGIDCSLSNATCSASGCLPRICTPHVRSCANGNVQECYYDGLSLYTVDVCESGTYCKAQGTSAVCTVTPCVPDALGCATETFGHCASDGMSVAAGATDCAAAGKVCTSQGCAATAIDTIASTATVTALNSDALLLDVLAVRSSRKLTEIEVYLSLPTSYTLTFAVYEGKPADSLLTFELKFQNAVTATGSGFQSSGAISYTLEADKFYAVGVGVTGGGGFVAYTGPTAPPTIQSFASVTGASIQKFSTTVSNVNPATSTVFHERLTTTPP